MLNDVNFIGNLTKAPELRKVLIKNGQEEMFVTTITIAVDRRRSNIPSDGTDFFEVTVWGRQAENCAQYLDKGSRVYVNCYTTINRVENNQTVRFYTQFTAKRVLFLSPKPQQSSNNQYNNQYADQGNNQYNNQNNNQYNNQNNNQYNNQNNNRYNNQNNNQNNNQYNNQYNNQNNNRYNNQNNNQYNNQNTDSFFEVDDIDIPF